MLFSRYMRGWTVGVHVKGTAYDGVTNPIWLQGILEQGASWLDVSACVNEEGIVTVAVVNISETEDISASLAGAGKDVTVYTVSGPNVQASNKEGKEEVAIKESKWDGSSGKFTFPKHSMTMLRWETGKKIVEVSKKKGSRIDTHAMTGGGVMFTA